MGPPKRWPQSCFAPYERTEKTDETEGLASADTTSKENKAGCIRGIWPLKIIDCLDIIIVRFSHLERSLNFEDARFESVKSIYWCYRVLPFNRPIKSRVFCIRINLNCHWVS